MYRKLILFTIIVGLGLSDKLFAQQSLPQVDALTYRLFQQKAWGELIKEGKKAIQNGMDFYYLRVRMGIAFFEKTNYHEAIRHLEKASKMNNAEAYIQEYLYYAYLFAGRNTEARLIAADLPPALKKKTQTEQMPVVGKIDLAYNYTGQSDPAVLAGFTAEVPIEIDGVQFIPNKHRYYYLGLELDIAPRFSLYQGFSYLQVDHLLYSQLAGEQFSDKDYLTTLHQYYVAGNVLLSKGLTLVGGIHLIRRIFPVTTEVITGPSGRPEATRRISNMGENDLVGFLSLYKRFNKVTLGASFYRGSLFNFTQNQGDAKLIYYPFGNLNLYTQSTFSFHQQDFGNGNTISNSVFDQQIGFRTTPWLWVEGYGTSGNMNNFLMKDGRVIFNRMDTIRQRLGGRFIFLPGAKLKLTLDYTLFRNESEFFPYSGNESFNKKEYNAQSLTGIFTWTF
ncbi:tetratricopeptide repeat protein [Lunatibacter salilacus]|uniref:tetratricopeptide repeat protein n=1 Tax=Lunatibacter salilacus TaxID=2483804 RepID=UPI00131BA673|nr:hypothetical protein [Lunatibacter salilacus]